MPSMAPQTADPMFGWPDSLRAVAVCGGRAYVRGIVEACGEIWISLS